jgi:DNA invertase Pin-like site-specific DNA recombinase
VGKSIREIAAALNIGYGTVQRFLIWRLDRFGSSVLDVIARIVEVDAAGVRFVCPAQGIDTDRQSANGKLLVPMLPRIAECCRIWRREGPRQGQQAYGELHSGGENFYFGTVGTRTSL